MSDTAMLKIIRKMREKYDLQFSERVTLAVLAGRLTSTIADTDQTEQEEESK